MALHSLGQDDTEFNYYYPSSMDNLILHSTVPKYIIEHPNVMDNLNVWLVGAGRDFIFEHSWLNDPKKQMEAVCSVCSYNDREATLYGFVILDDLKLNVTVKTHEEINEKKLVWDNSYKFIGTKGNVIMAQYGTEIQIDDYPDDSVISFGLKMEKYQLSEEVAFR